ncbi:MAG TPA: hypothetical protein IAB53_10890 [Candidatus Scybalocola faecipullorum]|nr:hypothetical protein [Candidatus Scybalocola faecipullorum]
MECGARNTNVAGRRRESEARSRLAFPIKSKTGKYSEQLCCELCDIAAIGRR